MQQNNGLDKNQLIIFALFSMIIIGAMFYFQNKQAAEQQLRESQNPTQVTQTAPSPVTKPAIATNLNDSVQANSIQQKELKNKE